MTTRSVPQPTPEVVPSDHETRVHLPIDGMTCGGCAARVQRALVQVPGVRDANVNFATERATIAFMPGEVRVQDLARAIRDTGYTVPSQSVRLDIRGMTCASCAGRVESALQQAPGVDGASVNLASERATIALRPEGTVQDLIRAVEDAGYQAQVAPTDDETRALVEAAERRVARRELAILVGSAALSLPLVLPMLGMPFGVDLALPGWVQLGLALPVQVVAGARFYKGAWNALRHGAANMDVLIALGTTAAFGLSLWQMAQGVDHLYFESAAVILTLVLFGKWLEGRAKRSTTAAIRALMALRPDTARVLRTAPRWRSRWMP